MSQKQPTSTPNGGSAVCAERFRLTMRKIASASVCVHLGPKKKALQKGCWICWVLTGTIFLFLVLPFHFFFLYVMNQGPRTPCYGKWGLRAGDHDVRSTFRQGVYLHRGNVLAAQENTLGAFTPPSPASCTPQPARPPC